MLKLRRLRDLIRDRRGNMLMLFAFAVIPITFATGMGIDYAGAMRLQTRLNAVTDAAALAAVTAPMMKQPMDAACTAARATFTSQVTGITGLTINAAQQSDVTISITDTLAVGGDVTVNCTTVGTLVVPLTLPISRTAVVTYKARSTNNFSAILGSTSLGIGGTATSKATLAPYIDIHIALDTSQSMGLAATDQAARDLWQKTGQLNGRSCQFGCHERDPNEKYSNEDIANTYNIPLRVNVLRDATIDMIDTATSNQGTASNYQFALYRIGKNNGRWSPGIDRYVPLTTDLANVRSKVQTLRLSPNDGSVGFGDTDLPSTTATILPYMNATSSAFDDGTTQAKARKFLFIVTDGVTDTEGRWCTWGHCTAAMDPATCDAYKAKGVTVGVVYTTYLPTRGNPMNPNDTSLRVEYTTLIQPIANDIRPNLQKCASSGWFFEASDQTTIHAAMQTLFRQATQTPALIR